MAAPDAPPLDKKNDGGAVPRISYSALCGSLVLPRASNGTRSRQRDPSAPKVTKIPASHQNCYH